MNFCLGDSCAAVVYISKSYNNLQGQNQEAMSYLKTSLEYSTTNEEKYRSNFKLGIVVFLTV